MNTTARITPVFLHITAFFTVFCSTLPVGLAQESLTASDVEALGDAAYRDFDNVKALVHYQHAFQYDTTAFYPRLKLSRTHYDYGLDQLARNDQQTARTHFERATEHARILVTLFPDSAKAHFMYAATLGNLALFEGGKRKVAIGRSVEKHSRRAIEIDSTFAYAYVALGIYYRELAQLNWIERALARMFYGRLPDITLEDVLALLLRAAELKPDFPFLHFELAQTYLTYGMHARALSHLETLVKLSPQSSQDVRNQRNAQALIEELKQRLGAD